VNLRAGLDDLEKRNFLTLPWLQLDNSVVQLVARGYTVYAKYVYSHVFIYLFYMCSTFNNTVSNPQFEFWMSVIDELKKTFLT
jgi:hypothetical protein